MSTLWDHINALRRPVAESGHVLCKGCGDPYSFDKVDTLNLLVRQLTKEIAVRAECLSCNAIAFIVFQNPEVKSHLIIKND